MQATFHAAMNSEPAEEKQAARVTPACVPSTTALPPCCDSLCADLIDELWIASPARHDKQLQKKTTLLSLNAAFALVCLIAALQWCWDAELQECEESRGVRGLQVIFAAD